MNVFQTHSRIVDDYATYIRSFLNIADPQIRGERGDVGPKGTEVCR
jgi:hypothetical protein